MRQLRVETDCKAVQYIDRSRCPFGQRSSASWSRIGQWPCQGLALPRAGCTEWRESINSRSHRKTISGFVGHILEHVRYLTSIAVPMLCDLMEYQYQDMPELECIAQQDCKGPVSTHKYIVSTWKSGVGDRCDSRRYDIVWRNTDGSSVDTLSEVGSPRWSFGSIRATALRVFFPPLHHCDSQLYFSLLRPSPQCQQKTQVISKTSKRNSAVSGSLSSGGRTLARRPFFEQSATLRKTRKSTTVMGTRYASKSTYYTVVFMRSHAIRSIRPKSKDPGGWVSLHVRH